jgi:cAMP-dependent protein kinase regulator
MMTQENTPFHLQKYLEEKKVKSILVPIVESILLEKPSEPVSFIVKHLMTHYPSETMYLLLEYDKQSNAVDVSRDHGEELENSESESDSDSSDACEEEEEVSNDPAPLPHSSRPRRSSICAEKICQTKVGNEEFKIIPKSEEERGAIKEILRKCVLFEHLDESQIKNVEDAMFPLIKQEGEIIIKQNDNGDNFYLIEKGEVDVYIESKEGDERKLVNSYSDGDSFGELAIMYNAPRAATCISKNGPVKLWALDRTSFKIILMKSAIEKRNKYMSFLRDVPILSQLTEFEMMTIADALHEEYFETGDILFQEGEIGDRFYIVESGSVVCTKKSADDTIQQVAELRKGSYFGEIALLTSKTRQATVTVSSRMHSLSLDSKTFKRVMRPLQDSLIRTMEKY